MFLIFLLCKIMNYGIDEITILMNDFWGGIFAINILNNPLYIIIIAILVFFVVYFGLKFLMKKIHTKIKQYTKDKKENVVILLLNIVKDMPRCFFFALEIYVPLKILNLPSQVDSIVNLLFLFVVTVQIIMIISKVLVFSFAGLLKDKNSKSNKTTEKTIHFVVNILVWVVGILIFLTNMGIDLTPLVASIGVASIAVAFALQSLLTDLFASFSIMISKPFDVGDYIAVGEGTKEKSGTVTNITFKATELLSIGGQMVVIPNNNILTTEVMNYGRMNHRRKRFTIGVTYETSTKLLREIPAIVQKVVEKQKLINYEWTYLSNLGTYSIDFFISYDILEPDYILSLDIHEKIILGIIDSFIEKGIKFAYPTQTIHTYDIQNLKK